MATTNASDGGFRRWRRSRPFWGGLLLLIAGLELFLSANLTLGDLEVHMGPEGFLSYLLPLLLVLAGVLTWVTPGQRLFYGVLGLLTAVYSLIGLNLGGFGLGMLLGILGGALVLAWAPRRPAPAAAEPAPADEDPYAAGPGGEAAPAEQQPHDPGATMIVPGFTGGPDDPASPPTPLRPAHQGEPARADRPGQHAQPDPQFPASPAYPGQQPSDGEPPRPPSGGRPGRTFVIALVAPAMTAALLIAGSHRPARAEAPCPEGLPSRPAAAAKKEAARQSSAEPAPSRTAARKAPKPGAKPSASASAGPSAPAGSEPGDKTGNPIVDGWNGFVKGVGDLLGIGGGKQAEPAPSTSAGTPGPTGSATPSGSASPAPPQPGRPGSGSPAPGAPTGSASPSPAPSLSDIPCLGPRVFKEAGPDDLPLVSATGSTLETDSLTMYNSTYDGVVQLKTAKGTLSALKFSMSKAVNKPFSLTVPENGGRTTLIESNKLTTDGHVRFYTPEFKGKLFGVIPVTFTPQSPPPLTLPVLWFTDVRINLAFVRCDTLTGDPLKVSAEA
ncbi:DUF6114 domain-containing protein [Actinoplanes nipponensis]|uniref:Uncharacterized protein n=1 Tax=Actinoplanes nipponensis TaxID=135950 RepID=A0A919JJV6_9ACTN|nr:DUF6114 domain-containing protein [Actinoplanes nipponensis]GIE50792.1 hypothetical protein Ani05nite_43260 [Actinoplanes nipponensis]